ncbi:methyltransferase domain-containing protein [Croceivirga thetidis]|uniref:Class I SAM-dependent methyltransferase n=1 Tax=Croceivirga thetidis TaxID=2721623 RepID=A0ABX1GR58_9FLAO|nr:class I SAM-dependent methyltransferase [Croceivirga thetidis]
MVTKVSNHKCLWSLAESYSERIEYKPHNAFYDRPNTLRLLGEVKGKHILDAACGPGKYAEILMEQGATIEGFDISPKMVEMAHKRNKENGHFFIHDLSQPFSMFEPKQFDLVLCALAMHYVEDWNAVVKEFHRVLKDRGQVVISIEHPFFEYTYFKSKNYFKIEQVEATWTGSGGRVKVPSFRRPLMQCLTPFTDNGFHIEELLEPLPVPEFKELDPRHYKELREFPAFMMLRATKMNSIS